MLQWYNADVDLSHSAWYITLPLTPMLLCLTCWSRYKMTVMCQMIIQFSFSLMKTTFRFKMPWFFSNRVDNKKAAPVTVITWHWTSEEPLSEWLWRHQMETFCVTVPLCGDPPVTGGFHSQRDSNADLWFFFVVSLNKLLKKHSF